MHPYTLDTSTVLLIFNQNIDVMTMSARMDSINLWLGKPVIICSDITTVKEVRGAVQSHMK